MVTPFNFVEFEGSIIGCALFLIEDLYGLFGVYEIGLELVIFFQNLVDGWLETLFKLRDMEGVMNSG